MPETFKLPNLPSQLLRLALDDLEACERDTEKYAIDMGYWFLKSDAYAPDPTCRVCLAGAIMAQHASAFMPPAMRNLEEMYVTPGEFTQEVCSKFQAIDLFRKGEICLGLETLGLPRNPEEWPDRIMTPYKDSPFDFRQDIEQLMMDFKTKGF